MHIAVAHQCWRKHLKEGEWVVDATCGNGRDTLFLAECVLGGSSGGVIGLDIQEQAIENTRLLLKQSLPPSQYDRIHLYQQSHATFPSQALGYPISLIVYNLGYLPKGKKQITTTSETTLASIEKGLSLLTQGGMISITCYSGHPEGAREESALITWTQMLSPTLYSIYHHRWSRHLSPSLMIIRKISL
jgi:hypothetical protein